MLISEVVSLKLAIESQIFYTFTHYYLGDHVVKQDVVEELQLLALRLLWKRPEQTGDWLSVL